MFSKNFWRPIFGSLIAVLLICAMIFVQNRSFYDAVFWIGFVIELAACGYLMFLVIRLANKQRVCENEQKKEKNTVAETHNADTVNKEQS